MRISDWSSDVCSSDLREIFEVRAAAEHLDPVVRAVVDLDVIERGAGSDAGQRQAVDFLVLRKLETGIADMDILHRARIVGGGGAAEQRVRGAFELALAVRGTTRSAADAIGDRSADGQDHPVPPP